MPNEKIEVGYRHIGTVAGVEYHHKFLLYTDKNGQQYTISGWTDEENQNPNLPFGNIRVRSHWQYDKNNADSVRNQFTAWYRNQSDIPISPQKQYREPIAEAPDLSAKWAEMVRNAQSKDNIYPYDYLRQNSNTLADTVLREAGFPEPEKDGMRHHLAPGSGNRLDRNLIPKSPDNPSISDIGHVISMEEDTREQTPQTAEKAQSKYEETMAMLQGLLNDTDGSYAKKILADHPEQVARFEEKVQQALEEQRQQDLALQESQNIQQQEQQMGFSRSI